MTMMQLKRSLSEVVGERIVAVTGGGDEILLSLANGNAIAISPTGGELLAFHHAIKRKRDVESEQLELPHTGNT